MTIRLADIREASAIEEVQAELRGERCVLLIHAPKMGLQRATIDDLQHGHRIEVWSYLDYDFFESTIVRVLNEMGEEVA